MKTSFLCVSCFFRQGEFLSDLCKLPLSKKEKFLRDITKRLLTYDFNNPPVVFGRYIYKRFSQISKIKDPFKKEKNKIECSIKSIVKELEAFVDRNRFPLYFSAKLSCLGNAIDFGRGEFPNLVLLKRKVRGVYFKINHFKVFRQKLRKSKTVLILADNVGETFFDRIFLKEIKKFRSSLNLFYATRSSPIINDAQLSDAYKAGIDNFAKVISTGCDYPGVILDKTSSNFKRVYKRADLIIAKGQGNFESFTSRKDTFYLFQVKCPPVSKYLSVPLGSFVFFYNRKISLK
ncbi:MAG: hypothetical protein DRP81_01205 [Candidatus Omnitrophota bacterium]|nr:MAG: hypothetical protein DRP72_01810 [Candidatus Omnitrophota bacterium]RKY46264.1 MAG: hypothetical protein DRP81_01205 [Candidatus Omnitrophota bacterium]